MYFVFFIVSAQQNDTILRQTLTAKNCVSIGKYTHFLYYCKKTSKYLIWRQTVTKRNGLVV
jgi:hypothetical protein